MNSLIVFGVHKRLTPCARLCLPHFSAVMYGGLWSNILYDDSAEDAAQGTLTPDSSNSWYASTLPSSSTDVHAAACPIKVVSGGAFNGNQSLSLAPGNPACAAINRGLVVSPLAGSIYYVGGQPYEGYVFLKAVGNTASTAGTAAAGDTAAAVSDTPDTGSAAATEAVAAATIRVSLLCNALGDWVVGGDERTSSTQLLGFVDIPLRGVVDIGVWLQYNFTITPDRDCRGGGGSPGDPGADPTAGQGLVALSLQSGPSNMAVQADKMMVEPGASFVSVSVTRAATCRLHIPVRVFQVCAQYAVLN